MSRPGSSLKMLGEGKQVAVERDRIPPLAIERTDGATYFTTSVMTVAKGSTSLPGQYPAYLS
jgi:hypothetical protein